LSNAAVASVPSEWLVTARPTSTDAGRLVNVSHPSVTHGSLDDFRYSALIVFPWRNSRSHTEGASAGPAVCTDGPPSVVHRWKARPFTDDGVANSADDPRIITPAFVHWSMFSMATTRVSP
jgi:hypothetical protein